METIIRVCRCEHSFQDRVYGRKRRVHNVTQDKKNATCTVCENKRPI